MRVLVTGASGVFGRNVSRWLVRSGAEVVGFARRPVDGNGVTGVSGDIRDADAVLKAAQDCDRIVHLAWAFSPLKSAQDTADVNLVGTSNVLRAAESESCRQLVFASSITAYGAWPDNPPVLDEESPLRPDPKVLYAAHKAKAEELVLASGIPSVITRSVVVVGRTLDNYEFRFLASPVLGAPSGPSPRWQLAHEDDVGRFHAAAALGDQTGVVNVGPTDLGLTLDEMAEVLDKRLLRVPMRVLRPVVTKAWDRGLLELDPSTLEAFQFMPVVSTRKMVEEWGFVPGYTSRQALQDTAGVLSRTWYFGAKRFDKPWRLSESPHRFSQPVPAQVPHLVDPAPAGLRGELDGFVDPAWPRWSSANVSEAFPGPMTPLSLTVALDCLGCSGVAFVDFLGMEGRVAEAQRTFPIASFGHRVYTNFSVVHAMAEGMPGTDADEIEEQFLGSRPERTTPRPRASLRDGARVARRVLPKVGGLPGELERIEAVAAEAARSAADVQHLDRGALQVLIEQLHDRVVDAWVVSTSINMVAAGLQGMLRKAAPDAHLGDFLGGSAQLASARLVTGIDELGGLIRQQPHLGAQLASAAPAELSAVDPGFGRAFAQLLDDIGHRGPGETELENAMYRDRPDLLLGTVIKAVERPLVTQVPSALGSRRAQLLARNMHAWLRRRERARDAVVRITHGLRVACRAYGHVVAQAGDLYDGSDVFYLTYDELFSPAAHRHLVSNRRAERERLRGLVLPTSFDLSWEVLGLPDDRSRVDGLGVSPGVIEGIVRIVDESDIDDLQPGEVLVAHVTDVGWTSAFGWAGAVVTDIGGALSHAAIVAREVGIPCVVATEMATQVLRTGQKVRVDGTTGAVEVLG